MPEFSMAEFLAGLSDTVRPGTARPIGTSGSWQAG